MVLPPSLEMLRPHTQCSDNDKFSLRFILSNAGGPSPRGPLLGTRDYEAADENFNTQSQWRHQAPINRPATRPAPKKPYEQMTKEEKRKARACRVEGCESYIINRGLCFRHGGGKRCTIPGCDASAKHQERCWKHGGSTNCIIDGCTRRGKARGLCWAHGGGTQCIVQGCVTIAVSNGKCWAHGGGKRCAYEGCARAAYERTYNYCMKHHELLQDGSHSVEV